MPLQKTPVTISFNQGIDTKSDPYQIQIGQFKELVNSVFDVTGRMTKRNGFPRITTLPNDEQTTITTLNDNLIATGSSLYAYSSETDQWLNQGSVQPVDLSVQSLVRSSTSQTAPDAAITSNGLICLAYVDTSVAYYQISDSTTGQQIVARTALPSTAANPRAFLLGNNFIITFTVTVTATPHLQYIAIPVSMPTSPSSATDISSDVKATGTGYNAHVANNALYVAWAASASKIKVTYLTSTLVVASAVEIAAATSDIMSVTADNSASTPVIWISFWDSSSTNLYSAAYDQSLNVVLAKTVVLSTVTLAEITGLANNQILTLFYETVNYYSSTGAYPTANIRSDYVSKITVTQAGVVGSPAVVLRSVGLASRAFLGPNNVTYMLVAYGSPASPTLSAQPSYFLIDSSGNTYSRLAYSNGGGYASSQVLPTVTLIGTEYCIPYLITDFLASVNKGTSLPSGTPTSPIYTQTGVSLAKFTIGSTNQHTSEIAGVLNLTGGQLWMYDGVRPVENNFHVWPENVAVVGNSTVGGLLAAKTYYYSFTYEWTDNQGNLHRSAPSIPLSYVPATPPANFTANRTSGSATLAAVSSFTGLQVGQAISGTGIPAATYIVSLNSGASTLVMSATATSGTATSTTVTPVGVTSVSLYVPTLRLTYKIAPNPVRIVGYRWSTDQQIYYQFTSLTSPTTNSTTSDYVTITDANADSAILGNTLLYTTGGVVENIAPPASVASALVGNRVMLIDAEDRNLVWYSKQVIQNVPVEFSDLFTIYVAPTSGAQGSTGELTCLSAMDDKTIFFKHNAIYYQTGRGPDNAGANNDFSDPIFVTSSVGCDNPNSIVLTPMGLMFQSDKGIWLLDRGLGTKYIGDRVEQYNSDVVESALVIPGTNQVRFILDSGVTLMYDYYFDRWGTFSNLNAVSATLYQSAHTYLNQYGQVFQESPGTYLDGSSPVLMSFTTGWLSLAGLRGFERFYFMFLLGTYITPFKLNVQLAYDYNDSAIQNIMVTPDNASPAYGEDVVYGGSGPYGGPGNVFMARLFPKKQKCQTFQVSVTEIYDSTLGVAAGEGLSLSGMNIVIGAKKGYNVQKGSKSFG